MSLEPERDYWVTVTVGGGSYDVGVDLYKHGDFDKGFSPYLCNYLVFDNNTDLEVTCENTLDNVLHYSLESLYNVYWHEENTNG
jgi:hypothetical protein